MSRLSFTVLNFFIFFHLFLQNQTGLGKLSCTHPVFRMITETGIFRKSSCHAEYPHSSCSVFLLCFASIICHTFPAVFICRNYLIVFLQHHPILKKVLKIYRSICSFIHYALFRNFGILPVFLSNL